MHITYEKYKNEEIKMANPSKKTAQLTLLDKNNISYTIVGRFFETIKDKLIMMAKKDIIVLITGETGTGKELIAQALHAESGRAGKFILINCAAIPDNLFESVLFGHEKGSFTGASNSSIGMIRSATNGTVLLDEIGDIPLHLQAKLLRFLQEKEVQTVGSDNVQKIDVRILAATNKNLEEEVQSGHFRSDLYYRISSFNIDLPPLRERLYDMEALINHFLKKCATKHNIDIGDVTKHLKRILTEHYVNRSWPGNIRELERAIESYLIFSEDGTSENSLNGNLNIHEAKERVERNLLIEAHKKAGGKISKIAQITGLSIDEVTDKLRRLKIK